MNIKKREREEGGRGEEEDERDGRESSADGERERVRDMTGEESERKHFLFRFCAQQFVI